jgi:hypothetical protein
VQACDSCGFETDQRWAVRRVYVTPQTWDSPGSTKVVDEVEHWCFACLSHYPHEPLEG